LIISNLSEIIGRTISLIIIATKINK